MSSEESTPLARRILIIDDELPIRRAIANAMRTIADEVLHAESAAQGIDLAAAERPDLVILDLGLPDREGVEVCHEIRRWATMPIIVLSARHSEREKVRLLNAGADDYVTKPFNLDELTARVRAQLRRASLHEPGGATEMRIGDLLIELPRRRVSRDNRRIELTPLEWEILSVLARHAGRTLTHQQIFEAAWSRKFGNAQQYLRVHVTNLRRKIEMEPAEPKVIVTDPGVGYRLETDG